MAHAERLCPLWQVPSPDIVGIGVGVARHALGLWIGAGIVVGAAMGVIAGRLGKLNDQRPPTIRRALFWISRLMPSYGGLRF